MKVVIKNVKKSELRTWLNGDIDISLEKKIDEAFKKALERKK